VYSFPVPVGRRGTAALLVIGIHMLLVAALLASLVVQLPKPDVPREPPVRYLPPKPEVPVAPVTLLPGPTHITLPAPDPVPLDPVLPPAPTVTAVVPPVADAGGGTAVPVVRSAARVLRAEEPLYPAASRRLGEEGVVTLRVLVGAIGRAERVEIERSSGFVRLDAAAASAVQRWEFQPAASGSGPVPSWTSVRVVFRLTR
jgi:periplasmic protein TonB